jgi:dTDP-D-glucose 4,6-dehydratase
MNYARGYHPPMQVLVIGGTQFMGRETITQVMEKVTRLLGVSPIAFEEGLRRSYEWYLAQPRRPVDYTFEDRLLAKIGD